MMVLGSRITESWKQLLKTVIIGAMLKLCFSVVQNNPIQKKIINDDKIYVKTEEISEKKSKCNIS